MARGASGISGFVYGISVNVKHTFLRRKKKKRINGKRTLKERKKRGETVTPACSQNAPEFYQRVYKHSLWYKTNAASKQSVQLPEGEVKQDKQKTKNKLRIKATESIAWLI